MRINVRAIRPDELFLRPGRIITGMSWGAPGGPGRGKRSQHPAEKFLIDRDKRVVSFASHHEKPGVPEDFEVVRDRGLGEWEKFSDLTTGELPRRRELLDHAKSSRFR